MASAPERSLQSAISPAPTSTAGRSLSAEPSEDFAPVPERRTRHTTQITTVTERIFFDKRASL